MRESGDLLTPRFNYANRFQKPVLYYWAVTASYAALGVTEASARLPAALSGIALALLAWICGRRWFGETTGHVAGLVAATSLGPAVMARLALPDLPLALFISLAIVIGIEAALVPERPRPWLMALAGAAAGAAFLTKGPVGIALPGLGTRGARRDRAPVVRAGARSAGACDGSGAAGRDSLVRGDGARAWRRIPPELLRQRQPGTLCHGPLQRSPSHLVLSADSAGRRVSVESVRGAVGTARVAHDP